MIGGEHHQIVQSHAVEQAQEAAEIAVERHQLQAHLDAAVAVAVADEIGCRQADRQQVGSRAAPELELIDQRCGHRQGRGVELRRSAEPRRIAGGAGEPEGADIVAAGKRDRAVPFPAKARRDQRRARPTDRGGDRLVDPFGDRRGRGGVRDEAAIVPPPNLIGSLAAHHHRRAILAADRDRAAARAGALLPIAERRHTKMSGRDARPAAGRGQALVLGAIDVLVGARRGEIDPVVGDDPVPGRVRAGEDRCMAGTGLGGAVRLIAVAVDDAADEPLETTGEMGTIKLEQIGRQLIDRDRDDQLGPCGRRGGRRRKGDHGSEQGNELVHSRFSKRET